MVFSSQVFLFLFLPIVLGLYLLGGRRLRNGILLLASLFFYAWGEGAYVLLMVVSITANYVFGRGVDSATTDAKRRLVVLLAIVFNLGLLVYFKYGGFLWENFSGMRAAMGGTESDPVAIHLPIGISFFTFQALSYVVDVYRKEGHVQKNPFNFGLYIALFPQLIAGPIVRYRDVASQIDSRRTDVELFASGVRRFVLGLGKKLLIADSVAYVADQLFEVPSGDLSMGMAWLGILCYTLQIYFDFSGYSDMAIGLGRMFGFRFLENFNYPYISRSITEFWRRWHISLSSWFRDYLYIPLGGNRKGSFRTYFNLVLVFFLCGLWHGASWSFVVWGLYHGAFLVIERLGLKRLLQRLPRPFEHVYVILVVMIGWVFFRAPSLEYALDWISAMFGGGSGRPELHPPILYLDNKVKLVLVCGLIGSLPWLPGLTRWRNEHDEKLGRPARFGLEALSLLGLAAVFLVSAMEMAASSYSPFIYFRF